MEFAGIDSRKFVRNGKIRDFIALLGVGVIVDDYVQFQQDYVEVIKKLLEKRHISITKKIYKSHDLNKLSIDPEFYREFYQALKSKIKKLFISYSYFSNSEVEIFPWDSKKKISAMEFLVRHLDSSYPSICLWELSKKGFNGCCFLDGINGKITNAWKEIESKNFLILPNGDRTNALISTADILINFLDNELFENRKKLNEGDIKEIFIDIKDKIEISFVSNACFYSIIPLSEKQNIPSIRKIAHPTIYVLKEKDIYIDEDAVENSPILKKIADFCFKKGGCYKFFDPKVDYESLSSEDYLFALGNETDKSIESLKRMGFEFKRLELKDLE